MKKARRKVRVLEKVLGRTKDYYYYEDKRFFGRRDYSERKVAKSRWKLCSIFSNNRELRDLTLLRAVSATVMLELQAWR